MSAAPIEDRGAEAFRRRAHQPQQGILGHASSKVSRQPDARTSRHRDRDRGQRGAQLNAAERDVSQPPEIPAVHSSGCLPTVGAVPFLCANPSVQRDHIRHWLDNVYDNPGQVRQKILKAR
ncbi:hypothetical protein ACFPOI_30185 [Nonomuraea angiospora]|uniref:Uncharacterized protein n=1 Tax=Nonomuraea angiospora TaxID=46172 RepID=A0ABR9LUM5_9ACTN|nr:hypothetical protein [Nonomuraea angiospora]MBE1584342.1 hypothetical protein [Nonomuraea angiospora]